MNIVKLKDIYKAVCDHIYETTSIQLADSDQEEPVIRPSFKVFMDTVNSGLYSSGLRSIKTYFNIYFYATDKKQCKSEIYEIEDMLAFSFLVPLRIKNTCAVFVDNLKFEKVDDGILNISFDFEIGTEFIDESNIEPMEELIINEKMEE